MRKSLICAILLLLSRSVHAEAPTSGLIAYWSFNEGSGTTAADSAGGNHGTLTNGPTWVAGKVGGALHTSGGSFVTVPNTTAINFSQSFTLTAWVKSDSAGAYAEPVEKQGSGLYQFLRRDSGQGNVWGADVRDTNGRLVSLFGRTVVSPGTWIHLALERDQSTGFINFFVNGTLEDSQADRTSGDITSTAALNFGKGNSGNFDGVIDEVRLYNRALSDQEIIDVRDDMGVPAGPDLIPPIISGASPSGGVPAGTTTTTLSVMTNEVATCKFGQTSSVSYANQPNTFAVTGATSHSSLITGLSDGSSYGFYVRCQDQAGNATTEDYLIGFSVASQTPPLPPPPSTVQWLTLGDCSNPIVTLTVCDFGNTAVGIYPRGILSWAEDTTMHSAHIGARKGYGGPGGLTVPPDGMYTASFVSEVYDGQAWTENGYIAWKYNNGNSSTLAVGLRDAQAGEFEAMQVSGTYLGQTNLTFPKDASISTDNLFLPKQKPSFGSNYLCIDSNGKVYASPSPCN